MQRTTLLAVPVFVAAAIALAACGAGGDPADSRAPQTVTASQSAQAGSVTSTVSARTAAAPTDTVAAHEPASTAAADQAARPVVAAIPRTLSPDDDTVSAQTFRYDPSGNSAGYYFRSPTGNVECGLADNSSALTLSCTARQSVRNMIAGPCANIEQSQYTVYLYKAGGRQNQCSPRAILSGEYYPPSGPVILPEILDYGQVVTIDGTTCASTTAGITCFHKGVGFTLARDRNEIH